MSEPARPEEEARDPEDAENPEERVVLTPGLVVLGILAVALGVVAGLVMSARSLAP